MPLRITPQDTSFFDLLTEAARHAVDAAAGVTELVAASPTDRPAMIERLRETEHAADETVHAIVRKVGASFVTPFDHVDIVDLAAALDQCVDELDDVGALVVLYRMDSLPDGALEVLGVITRMADLTADAMPRLHSLGRLEDYWIEINRLENRADVVYRRMLGELFDGSITDAVEILKRKDVIERIEAAANTFETVAHRVESIAVKGS